MSDPLLIALFDAAVRAARGEDLLIANSEVGPSAWRYFGPGGSVEVPLPQPGRGKVLVTGAGKAAASLARGLEAVLGDRIDSGAVLVKHGHGQALRRIAVLEGGHPVPDTAGLAGTRQIMQTVEAASENDTMFFVLTGGASALLVEPAPGIVVRRLADCEPAARERRRTDRRDQCRAQASVGGDRRAAAATRAMRSVLHARDLRCARRFAGRDRLRSHRRGPFDVSGMRRHRRALRVARSVAARCRRASRARRRGSDRRDTEGVVRDRSATRTIESSRAIASRSMRQRARRASADARSRS